MMRSRYAASPAETEDICWRNAKISGMATRVYLNVAARTEILFAYTVVYFLQIKIKPQKDRDIRKPRGLTQH